MIDAQLNLWKSTDDAVGESWKIVVRAGLFYSPSLMMRFLPLPSREMRIRHGAHLLRRRLVQGDIARLSAAHVGAPLDSRS
jgi:hypothetical protein